MKSLKTLVSFTALTVCMGAASMANAASFSPIGANFTTDGTGTIVVKSPSSFGAAVTCKAVFTGKVRSDGKADITNVVISPGSSTLCNLPKITGLPWLLTPVTTTSGTAANVGYTITAVPPLIPGTACGPSTINVTLASTASPDTITLSATNQALSGGCTVQSLNVKATGVTIIP
ncbi:alkane oxidation protein activator PraB [Pseudomonas tritici]|uniref:alkane oxidation protein activator PraB n=1 Tax=Pseudomonas tritici TaxID=2745518 RepID=UPI00387A9FF3